MQLPVLTKQIEIKGNTYKVDYPNNRVFLNIQARKAQLSKETYDSLLLSMDDNSRYSALLIDAIAFFEQTLPEQFFKDLNVKSILEGDLAMGAEIVAAYQAQIAEWVMEWKNVVAQIVNPKKEQEAAKDA